MNGVAAPYWVHKSVRREIMRRVGFRIGSSRIFSSSLFLCEELSIGDRCLVNHNCFFGDGSITIEDDVFIAPRVTLTPDGHEVGGVARRAGTRTLRPIMIRQGSWLGTGAIVLGGVEVASGCIIAAGAVVTRSTEPDGLYAGTPARRIRDL